jgi:hypothetical protein
MQEQAVIRTLLFTLCLFLLSGCLQTDDTNAEQSFEEYYLTQIRFSNGSTKNIKTSYGLNIYYGEDKVRICRHDLKGEIDLIYGREYIKSILDLKIKTLEIEQEYNSSAGLIHTL